MLNRCLCFCECDETMMPNYAHDYCGICRDHCEVRVNGQTISQGTLVWIEGYERCWMALPVTREHLQREDPINVEKPGLHLFGGFWYGEDPYDLGSYGKVLELPFLTVTRIKPTAWMGREAVRVLLRGVSQTA